MVPERVCSVAATRQTVDELRLANSDHRGLRRVRRPLANAARRGICITSATGPVVLVPARFAEQRGHALPINGWRGVIERHPAAQLTMRSPAQRDRTTIGIGPCLGLRCFKRRRIVIGFLPALQDCPCSTGSYDECSNIILRRPKWPAERNLDRAARWRAIWLRTPSRNLAVPPFRRFGISRPIARMPGHDCCPIGEAQPLRRGLRADRVSATRGSFSACLGSIYR